MTANNNFDLSMSPQGSDLLAHVRKDRVQENNLPNTMPLNVDIRAIGLLFDVPSEAISTLFKLMKELGSVSLALAAIAAKKLFNQQK